MRHKIERDPGSPGIVQTVLGAGCRFGLVKVPTDLAAVASHAAGLLGPAFAAAGVTVLSKLEPVTVSGDSTRLGQIVTSLLTNALKLSPASGHVRLTVAAGRACLEVRDEGPGIPREEVPHVFERFWRGSAGRRTSGSGIGLAVVAGLPCARRPAEVASEPGHGARFTVWLPRP